MVIFFFQVIKIDKIDLMKRCNSQAKVTLRSYANTMKKQTKFHQYLFHFPSNQRQETEVLWRDERTVRKLDDEIPTTRCMRGS